MSIVATIANLSYCWALVYHCRHRHHHHCLFCQLAEQEITTAKQNAKHKTRMILLSKTLVQDITCAHVLTHTKCINF